MVLPGPALADEDFGAQSKCHMKSARVNFVNRACKIKEDTQTRSEHDDM